MTFQLAIFPELTDVNAGYSIHKKPTWASLVQTPPSGREVTSFQQSTPLWEFELTFQILRDQSQNSAPYAPTLGFTELQTLSAFWMCRNGQYGAFVYQDTDDFSRTDQLIAVGDGTTTDFIMVRTWASGSYAFTEEVGIVDVRTGKILNVYLDGVSLAQTNNWWIDGDLRTLKFVNPPGDGVEVTADFDYFYFCRFIDDELNMEEFYTGRWRIESLKFRSTLPDPASGGTASDNPYSLPDQDTDLTTPQMPPSPEFVYFEMLVNWTNSRVFGDNSGTVCLGLANSSFNRDNPWGLDVNVSPIPSLDGSVFWSFTTNVTVGWGYPLRGEGSAHQAALTDFPQTIGIAIRRDLGKLFMRNCDVSPYTWFGGPFSGSQDPVTGVGGWDYSSTGPSPIPGSLFILAGCANGGGLPARLTLNFGDSAFVRTPPTGASPLKDLNDIVEMDFASIPGPAPGHTAKLLLGAGDLEVTGGDIIGSNGPTCFIISAGNIGVAP